MKLGSEATACRLAGVACPPECLAIEQWRGELEKHCEYQWYGFSRETRIENRLPQLARVLLHLRLAFAVRRLRKEERRWPLRGGTTTLPPFDRVVEPITGRPGVLCVISGSRRLAQGESLDVKCAFADLSDPAKPGLSDGITFGATGVRVEHGGTVEALVVWDNNRGASELLDLAKAPHSGGDKHVERCARRALRREARRLLNEARRHLVKRFQGQGEVAGVGESEAAAE